MDWHFPIADREQRVSGVEELTGDPVFPRWDFGCEVDGPNIANGLTRDKDPRQTPTIMM